MGSARPGGRSTSTGNNRADNLVAPRVFQDTGAEEGRPRHLQHRVRFVTICGGGATPVPGLDGIDTRGADEKVVQLRRFQITVFERDVLVSVEVQVVDQDEIVRKSAEPLYDRKFCDLSLIHISEPTRLGMISYAVFCLK